MSAALKLKDLQPDEVTNLLEAYTTAGVGITFECMLMYVPNFNGSFQPSGNKDLMDYTGVIRLKGNEFIFESCLSFPKETMEKVVKKIFGLKEGSIPDSHIDGCLGELTNTISGCLKAQLAKVGYECQLDLPELYKGKGAIVLRSEEPIHRFDFDIEGAPFSVFLGIHHNE